MPRVHSEVAVEWMRKEAAAAVARGQSMSEPVAKQRPTVDLDDFERRLRQHSSHDDDPLAEMARLVGEQHDPYGDVFAREVDRRQPEPERRQPAGHPSKMFADFAAIEAGLRGAIAPHGEAPSHQPAHPAPSHATPPSSYQQPGRSEPTFAAHDGRGYHHDPAFDEMQARERQTRQGQDPAYAQHPGYAQAPGYAQDPAYVQDPAYAQNPAYAQDPAYAHEQGYDPSQGYGHQDWVSDDRVPAAQQPAARSRRPVYVMAATIAICLVGIGGVFALKGQSRSPGEIKTIMAATGPTKIQPPEDSAREQAPDAAVTGASNGQTPTKLVTREEQPVDLAQTVQDNAARDAASHPETNASNVPVPLSPNQAQSAGRDGADAIGDKVDSFGLSGFPAPKRVKVVSVRPDGTILSTAEQPADAAPRQNKTSDKAGPVAKAATPKTTSRIAPSAKPEDAATDDAGATPKPTRTKPQRVATADPGEQNADATETPAAEGSGGFSVQLAAPASETDAKAALNKYARKYSGALSGHHLGYHRAVSNGKAVYRVRVGSLSKEQAVSMCEKLKSDGGSCFIAKN